jgi:hypothetical protein
MENNRDELIKETKEMLKREFYNIKPLITQYLHYSEPIDKESTYFRLLFMKKVCEDLLEIVKPQTSEELIGGAEMAIRVYDRSDII